MRKYLFPVLGVLFLAVLAPMSVDAKKADDTKVDLYYYQPPEYDVNLSAADMNSAQAVGVGTSVNVDFRVNDYKVFKLAIPANQIVRVDWAKSGNNQGNPSCIYYDASGKRVDYETAFGSEKAETYYMLAYSNSPVVSSFTVKSMMFSDNVTQKTSDGCIFGFIPKVTGTYAFNVQDSNYKNVSMYISGEYKDYKTTEGKYTYTVSATLTAGKFYKLQVYSHGKYTLTLTKSAAADAVANQIAVIGAATTSNGSAIGVHADSTGESVCKPDQTVCCQGKDQKSESCQEGQKSDCNLEEGFRCSGISGNVFLKEEVQKCQDHYSFCQQGKNCAEKAEKEQKILC